MTRKIRGGARLTWATINRSLSDGVPDMAAALAYYSFLAIPSLLLLLVGLFALFASGGTIDTLIAAFAHVMPRDATDLLRGALTRQQQNHGSTIALTVVGLLLASWTTIAAMTAVMRALNRACRCPETRGRVGQRLTAVKLLLITAIPFCLLFGLLILGPHIERWVGQALHVESVLGWLWWIAQWPILIAVLLAAFGAILYLGPAREAPFRLVSPGSVLATTLWLAVSSGFALYSSQFSSYNKVWGSFAAVIVMLTWLWLSAISLLLGAELDAEIEAKEQSKMAVGLPPRA